MIAKLLYVYQLLHVKKHLVLYNCSKTLNYPGKACQEDLRQLEAPDKISTDKRESVRQVRGDGQEEDRRPHPQVPQEITAEGQGDRTNGPEVLLWSYCPCCVLRGRAVICGMWELIYYLIRLFLMKLFL